MLKINFLEKHSNLIFLTLAIMALSLFIISSYLIITSPEDYLQGIYAKIMYIHVPCAWLASGIYLSLGISALAFLIWRNPIYDLLGAAIAPIGLTFTIITLVTGAVWGKPTWGAWWVWDARLTSMLILAFIYFGYIALRKAHKEEFKAAISSSVFAIIGLINIPIIKLSVYLWNTLHQKSSFLGMNGITIHKELLQPLLASTAFMLCFSAILILLRVLTLSYTKKVARLKKQSYMT